ncbi:MAG: BlaI/MecI/CopY family transcriptional regulator [Bacteroidales bacterium]|jgi:predicted transcriptional regulator|nr:BlaI/MecI/CopY family transcriptional regulator [Bacteroidales bacterium]MDD3273196.1 BlaI/MecI/CopY family transcriptional regulator [Bacteroidales bacterium]
MEKRTFKELTKAELQIMHLLWDKERAYINDLLEEMPEPRPAYNTVSTIVRILEKKGFVSHKSYGNTHHYFPIINKDTYLNSLMSGIMNSFFSGSVANLVSFLSKKEQLSVEEADKLINIIKNKK